MATKLVTTKVATTKRASPFLDDYLPYLLGHASEVMNKDFDRYVKATGLSPVEWRTLASLSDADGLTVGQLCKKVVAQQPTLTKALKRMDEVGLVRREDDAADLRKTRVFATPQGRTLARRLMRAALEHEADLLRHAPLALVDELKKALRGLLARRRG